MLQPAKHASTVTPDLTNGQNKLIRTAINNNNITFEADTLHYLVEGRHETQTVTSSQCETMGCHSTRERLHWSPGCSILIQHGHRAI